MIEKSNLLVSCVIPTYKRSDTLERAIYSALMQTHQKIEVLVVDDNTPGDEYSQQVKVKVDHIADPRVHYVAQERHINGAAARNCGIHMAQGEYVAFLDDDDEWLPEKIEKQLDLLMKHPDCQGCSCLYRMYKNGNIIREIKPYTTENMHYKVLSREVAVFTSTILARREYVIANSLFNEQLRRHQDLQFLLDFLLHHKMCVVNEYLVKLNVDSAVNRPSCEQFIVVKNQFFEAIDKHFKRYPEEAQKQAKYAHYFEVVLTALREKKIGIALSYIAKIGVSPRAYKALLVRMRTR